MAGTHLGPATASSPRASVPARIAALFLFQGTDLVGQRIYYDAGTIVRQLA